MSFLYQRHETSEQIEVKCKGLPLFYIGLLIAVVLSIASRGQWTNICMSAVAVFLIFWIVGLWKPMREIQKAMNERGVLVFGSKFSFTNPIRMIIKK